MPIVTVEIVGDQQKDRGASFVQSLADAAARALHHANPGQTWVRVRWVARDDYAENDSLLSTGQWPVFVSVLTRQVPVGPELEADILALTQAIAQVIGCTTDVVHIEYAPAAVGRISFGGKLVK
jgi:phenylpyruvate tautomerase PptA (4-oxalocrotonate tautomerase family)